MSGARAAAERLEDGLQDNFQDGFQVEPYSPSETRFHLVGAALNGLAWLAAIAWLLLAGRDHPPAWGWAAAGLLAGIYAADLASGLLHWAFDTWFDTSITFIRRMVLQVREHHVYPHRIFRISFTHDAGTLSWIALLLTAPVLLTAALGPGAASGPAFAAVLAAVVFNPLLVFMLEFHKCGHRGRNPAWVRALQRCRLVLPVSHHIRHHSGNHDVNYCIVTGWADLTLGRLGLFRGLERAVRRLTGAVPQRDDHEWLRRYGRPVGGRGVVGRPVVGGRRAGARLAGGSARDRRARGHGAGGHGAAGHRETGPRATAPGPAP